MQDTTLGPYSTATGGDSEFSNRWGSVSCLDGAPDRYHLRVWEWIWWQQDSRSLSKSRLDYNICCGALSPIAHPASCHQPAREAGDHHLLKFDLQHYRDWENGLRMHSTTCMVHELTRGGRVALRLS
jgi:hypothetical protein